MNYFQWNGQPIEDIKKWCEENNTKMIKYKASRKVPNPYSGKIEEESREGEMPELFFQQLRMSDGWMYEVIPN